MDTQGTEMWARLVDPSLDGQATTPSAIVDSRDAFDDRLSRLVGPKLVVDGEACGVSQSPDTEQDGIARTLLVRFRRRAA
jgi:hypothetical protein